MPARSIRASRRNSHNSSNSASPRQAGRRSGGAQHQTRQAVPQLGQQGENLRLGGAAAHALQNAVVDVLEGDVDVVEHLRFTGDDVDEGVVQIVGIQVVQADPVEGQLAQLGEQLPSIRLW